MPFTFAHPAAVLPLRRIRYLQTVALIVGSIAPDLPYFVPGRLARAVSEPGELRFDTHNLAGSFIVDVPLGMAVLLFLFLLRAPLVALLGQRARSVCMRAMERYRRPLDWVLAPVSVLLGVWTHILWDSFTHSNGWMVRRVAALSAPISFGWYTGEVCHVLQYVSSVFGLTVLAVWYSRVRAAMPTPANTDDERSPNWFALAGVLLVAGALGAMQAMQFFAHSQAYYRVFFVFLTRTIAWGALLYLVAGVLATVVRKLSPGWRVSELRE